MPHGVKRIVDETGRLLLTDKTQVVVVEYFCALAETLIVDPIDFKTYEAQHYEIMKDHYTNWFKLPEKPYSKKSKKGQLTRITNDEFLKYSDRINDWYKKSIEPKIKCLDCMKIEIPKSVKLCPGCREKFDRISKALTG